MGEERGIPGVAVKCVEIGRKAGGKAARVPVAAQRSTTALTSGSCLIGQQKARTVGGEKVARKWATMRAESASCIATLKAVRRATISRRNARRLAAVRAPARWSRMR